MLRVRNLSPTLMWRSWCPSVLQTWVRNLSPTLMGKSQGPPIPQLLLASSKNKSELYCVAHTNNWHLSHKSLQGFQKVAVGSQSHTLSPAYYFSCLSTEASHYRHTWPLYNWGFQTNSTTVFAICKNTETRAQDRHSIGRELPSVYESLGSIPSAR